MEGSDWDSPRRTRAFLAAALVVAVGGTLFEARHDGGDVPSWEAAQTVDVASLPAGAGVASAGAPGGERQATGSAQAAADSGAAALGAGRDDTVRDAVASPAASWTTSSAEAARSAAFSASAGGKVPGAFAPAGGRAAHAAARSLAGAGGDDREGASGGSAPRPGAPGARGRPASPDEGSPRRGAVVTPRAAAAAGSRATPAERFFSGAELAGAALGRRLPLDGPQAGLDPSAAKKAARRARGKKLRPALLSALLGRRPLRAPARVAPPRDDPWSRAIPPEAGVVAPLGVAAAERAAAPPECGRAGAHWHDAEGGMRWYHDGRVWGRSAPEGWAWLEKEDHGLWLWPTPESAPLLRHEDHWWLRSRGLWFLLHDGEPWGAQYLREWGTEGFVHPSGAQMIYSADGTRVGLVEPDAGAVLYDAETGRELGRWLAGQLPRRKRPRAPAALPPLR